MKKIYICHALFVLAVVSCENSSDNNHGLDYESLDVHFSAAIGGREWAKDDVVGLFATCTRSNAENTPLAEESPARYVPTLTGPKTALVGRSGADNLVARASDHNFRFQAFTPYDPAAADASKLRADVPSSIRFKEEPRVLYVAEARATSVVAPVPLAFRSLACAVELQVPDDIVADSRTRLKTMVVRAADESLLTGPVAYEAYYDMTADKLTVRPGTGSKRIRVDFGDDGYEMAAGYTAVTFQMAPFTVPEGGFVVEFTDSEGWKNEVPLLAKKAGTVYGAGDRIAEILSSSSDGIVGCTPPVEWPIGYRGQTPMVTAESQPRWNAGKADAEHVWVSAQPQATITYHTVNTTNGRAAFELNNHVNLGQAAVTTYNYASPCIKGIGKGDYFEFEIPVKKFRAGTTVKLTLPTYGRGNPLFWDVEYLDGGAWKCDRKNHTSGPDRNNPNKTYSKECTLMIEHGNLKGSWAGNVYVVSMTHEKEIQSGYLRIRLKCLDHMIISSITPSKPNLSVVPSTDKRPGAGYDNLLAFVNKDGSCPSVRIEW